MRALLSWDQFDAAHGWHSEAAAVDGAPATILLGPEAAAPAPFAEAVPSWAATTPGGSRIELQLRARRDGRWTAFYRIAQWDSLAENSARRSFDAQQDADGRVATDTLSLAGPADAVQPRMLLLGESERRTELRALRLALSAPGARATSPGRLTPRELPVPARSQLAYPNGRNLCSPTCTGMLLAYWHAQTGDERLAPFAERGAVADLVVPQVYDPVYDGHGNWGFNTAFAAGRGLDGYVARFAGLDQLDPWLAAGVPLAISVAWGAGELDNAPIPASAGHLLIVAGFDAQGRVVVADPRGDDEGAVRRLYDAAQLERAWQANSSGTAYVIHPQGWPVPSMPRD